MEKAQVTGDWLEGVTYEALIDPQRWNGWAIPYFTKEVAEKVVEDQNRLHAEDPEGFPEWLEWDGDTLCYHSEDGADRYYDREDPVNGLYSIGGRGWCWIEAETANA